MVPLIPLVLVACCLWQGVAASPGTREFPLGLEVFAVRRIQYSTALGSLIVPEGTLGRVVENGTRIVVEWALELQATEGAVTGDLLEYKSCADSCAGLLEYIKVAGGATMDPSLNTAQRCLRMQGHAPAAACATGASAAAACVAATSQVQSHIEQCSQAGIDITSDRTVGALFQRVAALESVAYNTASGVQTIYAGTSGMIVERVGQRIVVEWELGQGETMRGQVAAVKIENVTCLDACEGLADYLVASSEAIITNASLKPAQRCMALQNYADTTICGLALDKRECPSVWGLLDQRERSCSTMGISLSDPAPPTNFVHTPCTYCSYVTGAVELSGQPFPEYHSLSMTQCEQNCSSHASCAAYDYDSMEARCRMWQRCPERSQRPTSCHWHVFLRPRLPATSGPDPDAASENTTSPAPAANGSAPSGVAAIAVASAGGRRSASCLTLALALLPLARLARSKDR